MANALVTVTYRSHGGGRIAVVDWLSDDAAGSATGTVNVNGQIQKFVTNPGSVAPTDNYDITLVDEDGIDVAGGLLVDRDTANSEEVYAYKSITVAGTLTDRLVLPLFHAGPLTFTLAAAGNAKTGQLKIYYR